MKILRHSQRGLRKFEYRKKVSRVSFTERLEKEASTTGTVAGNFLRMVVTQSKSEENQSCGFEMSGDKLDRSGETKFEIRRRVRGPKKRRSGDVGKNYHRRASGSVPLHSKRHADFSRSTFPPRTIDCHQGGATAFRCQQKRRRKRRTDGY